jgi:hypothetical protein
MSNARIYFYTLTIPNETTEPGRERDISLCSFSAAGGLGVGAGIVGASESGNSATVICFELRRGGGNKDVIPGHWSGVGGKGRGEGKEGVSNCQKLGSFCDEIIFSAMGVEGWDIRVGIAGLDVWTIELAIVFKRD